MADWRKPVLFVLAGTLMLGTVDVGAAELARKPALSIKNLSPLVLHGQRFRGLERVKLTVRAGDVTRRRIMVATRAGRFTAEFPTVTADRCNSDVWALAAGQRGSMATLRLGKLPQLQCPPGVP